MNSYIVYLEIENFKAYKDRVRIHLGELGKFTAIVGPNGAGKSNFMDALGFVLCEEPALTVDRVNELIHKDSQGTPIANVASVDLACNVQFNSNKTFTRKISYNSSTCIYEVDGRETSEVNYVNELELLKMHANKKHFLVFQGQAEQLAKKDSKTLTELFEEISGSIEEKAKYEHLQAQLKEAETNFNLKISRKRKINEDTKMVDELNQYQKLCGLFDAKQIQYSLFQLFYWAKEKAKLDKSLEENILQLEVFNNELEAKTKECGEKKKILSETKKKIISLEEAVLNLKPTLIEIRNDIEEQQEKNDLAKKCLAKATGEQSRLQKLEEDLKLEEERDENATLSPAQHMTDDQKEQNNKLRSEVAKANSYHLQELQAKKQKKDFLERELKSLKCEEQDYLTEIEMANEDCKLKLDKINKNQSKVVDLKDQVTQRTNDKQTFENISKQIDTTLIKLHSYEANKMHKDVVGALKLKFQTVHGRLIDICRPTHQKYNAAFEAVLFEYIGAIVVDSADTANKCIGYLKKKKLNAEIFISLDNLNPPPVINEKLRNIATNENVKLLFDVISFQQAEVKLAVLFATGHVLLCNTEEDAKRVAYNLGDGNKRNAVALNGTYFRQNGQITYGKNALEQHCDENAYNQLIIDKETKIKEYKRISKELLQQSEIDKLEFEIKIKEAKITYKKEKLEKSVGPSGFITNRNKYLQDNLEETRKSILECEESIKKVDDIIAVVKKKVDSIENIQDRLDRNKARNQKSFRLKKRIDKLKCEIEDVKKRVNTYDMEKLINEISHCENTISKAISNEFAQIKQLEDKLRELEDLKSYQNSIECELDELESQIIKLQSLKNDCNAKVTGIECEIEGICHKRHNMLIECKEENIKIKLEIGDWREIIDDKCVNFAVEDNLTFDFKPLKPNFKTLTSNTDIQYQREDFESQLSKMRSIIDRYHTPKEGVAEKIASTTNEQQLYKVDLALLRKKAESLQKDFDAVKSARIKKFKQAWQQVENHLNIIYEELIGTGAIAALALVNAKEPYLGEMVFNCIVPGKTCQTMDDLPNGERIIAAMALLFAFQRYQNLPVMVMDEVDRTLDNDNVKKLANYIRQHKQEMQLISISLNEDLCVTADNLTGLKFRSTKNILSLDSSKYTPPILE